MTAGLALAWLGAFAIVLAFGVAAAAARVRTMFAFAVACFACALCAALGALSYGAVEAALALAIAGAVVATVSILSATLHATLAARKEPLGMRLYPLAAGAVTLAAVLWAAPEAGLQARVLHQEAPAHALLLAAIALAGGFAVFGLVGLDERAVFDDPAGENTPDETA